MENIPEYIVLRFVAHGSPIQWIAPFECLSGYLQDKDGERLVFPIKLSPKSEQITNLRFVKARKEVRDTDGTVIERHPVTLLSVDNRYRSYWVYIPALQTTSSRLIHELLLALERHKRIRRVKDVHEVPHENIYRL